jgi:hypothetical protein
LKKQTFNSGLAALGATVIGAGLMISGCRGGGGDSMATVNGESISKEDYITYLEKKPSVLITTGQGAVTANVAQPLAFQALNDLVNQRLLVQMSKDGGVYPTDKDISDEILFQQTKRPDFIKLLTNDGLSMSQIKDQLRVELCRYKLITKGIKISEAQVEKYIKDNPKQFVNPKQVEMSWIVAKDLRNVKSIDDELKSGQRFAIVSARYSDLREPRYPSSNYEQFPPKLKELVDKLPEGGTSEWLNDSGSRVRFHVEKVTPSSKIEIKPWMKTEIQRQLALQKGGVAVDLDKRLLEKRKQAKLEIIPSNLRTRFDQVAKSLKDSDIKTGEKSITSTVAPKP